MISTSVLDDGALAPRGSEPHERWVASLPKFLQEILEDEYRNEKREEALLGRNKTV